MSQSKILLESGTNELEVIEFYLDEPGYRGAYGVNVAKVLEILREQNITAVPGERHPSVMGAFRHRDGAVVPLVDLACYLGKTLEEHEPPKVIVTEFNGVITAFQVSAVNRIHRISWEDVEPPSEMLQAFSQSAFTGVVRLEGRVVFLLDLESVVADLNPDLAVRQSAPVVLNQGEQVYSIVHADDSGSIRKMVKRLLEEGGRFQLQQATNGEEAWEMLQELKHRAERENVPLTSLVQAVITDVEMPRMDGLNLCKRIKEDPVLKQLPVALFSSLITDQLLHRGEAVGADAQFAKPELSELGRRLLELLGENI
ncbi:chemotaxis protein [Oleidesulfovibrio sp.]|uniref:chemotaxis protein n=1 Tax=Oleidesulfovibrio sp. TaxID=2909707 RepID=UPI003A8648B9